MPWQPATQFWRALEIDAVLTHAGAVLRAAQSLFDLGCGDGGIMALLRPQLAPEVKITGLDIDPQEVAAARETGIYETLLVASSADIPLPDAAFDGVFSNSVLEHIAPIAETLREAARLLKPGGRFIATVPGPDFHAALGGAWRPGTRRADYLAQLDRRLAHLRYWDRETWRAELARAGIMLDDAIPYMPQNAVRRWENLSRLTGGLLYELGGGEKAPIALQRRLRLRGGAHGCPQGLARALACAITARLQTDDRSLYGCLLLIGTKP